MADVTLSPLEASASDFTTLNQAERDRLAELEDTIERGLETFVDVGRALAEIRTARLYRETHGTFETYCRERWGMTRQHANRTVRAAEVVAALEPFGSTPASESIARELAPVLETDGPEAAASLLEKAREAAAERNRDEPTAGDVRRERHKLTPLMSSNTDLWATPQDLFDELHAEFGFALDVCATAENAKCERYFTAEDDGLAQEWTGTCWMNPPYGEVIGKWVTKAREAAEAGATVVCLVPARVDTGWWWDNCRHGEIRFLRGRLKFGGAETGAPFPSAVVIFGRPANVVWWER